MAKLKQKTRKGAASRFKITATGKVMFRGQNMRHLRRKKSKSAIRAAKVPHQLVGKYARKVKRMIGIA